jgi:hypothetical protein
MSAVFDPEKETHLTVTRESLGLIIGREIDHHEWMLISSLRNTSSWSAEPGSKDIPLNAHGEKPFMYSHIERDELKAYMVASKKYLGTIEWNALVSAMHSAAEYEKDIEKIYHESTGLGTGLSGSPHERLYKQYLVNKGISFKTPGEVVRTLLKEITIPPHYIGKYQAD